MPSENIMPNAYKNYEDVFKIANQIRRTTILYEELSEYWKLIIINNKNAILDDIKEIEAKDDVFFINVNDSYGNIKRTSVQLSSENMLIFANLLKEYSGNDNYLALNYPNTSYRIKKLFMIPQEEKIKEEEPESKRAYRIEPMEFFYYYKSFYPSDVIIEMEIEDQEVKGFSLYLVINTQKHLDALEPSFRKANVSKDEIETHLLNGNSLRLEYHLKTRILNRVKKLILNSDNHVDQLIVTKNPLNKFIFLDVANYDLLDIALS